MNRTKNAPGAGEIIFRWILDSESQDEPQGTVNIETLEACYSVTD